MSYRERMALTPDEHLSVGAKFKRAHALMQDIASDIQRCHPRLAERLRDILMGARAELERKLIEQVGADAMVEGVHVRDVYFGEIEEREDA